MERCVFCRFYKFVSFWGCSLFVYVYVYYNNYIYNYHTHLVR